MKTAWTNITEKCVSDLEGASGKMPKQEEDCFYSDRSKVELNCIYMLKKNIEQIRKFMEMLTEVSVICSGCICTTHFHLVSPPFLA